MREKFQKAAEFGMTLSLASCMLESWPPINSINQTRATMLYIVNIFAPFMIQQEFCLNLHLFINTLPQSPFLLQFLQFQLIVEMNLQLRKMSFKLNMNEPTGILRKLFMKGVDMHFCLLDLHYLFVDPLDFRYHRLNYMTYSCMSLCMIS